MVCHLPRLLLGFHEAWITENVIACSKSNQRAFPMWAVMVGHISHVMMDINSSVNGIIYGFNSPLFRKALKKKLQKMGCLKRALTAPVQLNLLVAPTENCVRSTKQNGTSKLSDNHIVTIQVTEALKVQVPDEAPGASLTSAHSDEALDISRSRSCLLKVHMTPSMTWPRVTRV